MKTLLATALLLAPLTLAMPGGITVPPVSDSVLQCEGTVATYYPTRSNFIQAATNACKATYNGKSSITVNTGWRRWYIPIDTLNSTSGVSGKREFVFEISMDSDDMPQTISLDGCIEAFSVTKDGSEHGDWGSWDKGTMHDKKHMPCWVKDADGKKQEMVQDWLVNRQRDGFGLAKFKSYPGPEP
jgi:hypothetical protein